MIFDWRKEARLWSFAIGIPALVLVLIGSLLIGTAAFFAVAEKLARWL